MKNSIELLAPGGDLDAVKAAIAGGADAIYCGVERFNARNRAANINLSDLPGVLRLAHENDCELFLTLNIVIVESEFPVLFRLLNSLVNMGVDGVIVQDLGLLYILYHYFPTLNVHASTQLTSHNSGQINFLATLGVKRINLCRELTLDEIGELTAAAHDLDILSEVFVHGSLCLSFSGLCYLSSFQGGNSGNRGRCSQPCRDRYETCSATLHYPLNLKDNSAFSQVAALAATGVDSFKVEGRIKKFHYVYTVVHAWRKQLQRLGDGRPLRHDKGELRQVFNRDFSSGYLTGNRGEEMFID
jgi:putative protease